MTDNFNLLKKNCQIDIQVDYKTPLTKTSKFILQLTVEDYVQTLEKLTSDMRFTIYVMLYKRILVIWIVLAFVILLSLLFSGFQNIELFACGVVWLILNAGAIFFCMWVKIKVSLIILNSKSYVAGMS